MEDVGELASLLTFTLRYTGVPGKEPHDPPAEHLIKADLR